MGNTPEEGKRFGKGLKRDHSFPSETGEEVRGVEAGDPLLLHKARDHETGEAKGPWGEGLSFVSEADPD